MKFQSSIIFIFFFAFSISAQTNDYEYGKPAEFKGLTSIYINTGTDVESREIIVKEIEKADVPLKIVDDLKDAEIFLMYQGGMKDVQYKATTDQRSTGKGFVAIKGKTPDRLRLLLSFEDTKNTYLEKKPAIKFAREFVKVYKKANDSK